MISKKVKQEWYAESIVKEYSLTKNEKLKQKAIEEHLALVKKIVDRISLPLNGLLSREDLYQFGVIGLIDAIERFEANREASFKTFAYKRVYGAVIDAIRKETILSRREIKNINNVTSIKERLSNLLGREPTPIEICKEANLTMDDYHRTQQSFNAGFNLSLEENVCYEGDSVISRKDTIVDEEQMTPDKVIEREELKKELKSIIKNLPERQKLILALYYYEELTLTDIGQVLGISESRVSQILGKTLAEIRKKLEK